MDPLPDSVVYCQLIVHRVCLKCDRDAELSLFCDHPWNSVRYHAHDSMSGVKIFTLTTISSSS